MRFYKGVWLRSPRFLINNNITNVMMAMMSGTHPQSFLDASKKRFKDFIGDDVTAGQIAEMLADPHLTASSTGNSAKLIAELWRQDGFFKAAGPKGAMGFDFEPGNRRLVPRGVVATLDKLQDWNEATESFFRRAAFIDRTRSIAKSVKGRDLHHLERLAKEFAEQAGSMDHHTVMAHLVDMRQLLVDMSLNEAMIHNMDIVRGSAELTMDAVKHVNKWFFDYKNMLPIEREVIRRVFPFWGFQRGIHKLMLNMPKDHPGRSMIASHLAMVANDITGQEELPPWLKGSVEFSSAGGREFISERTSGSRTRLRAGGANPTMGLLDPEGFHPVLGFMVSYITGAKTFPAGGRFSDPEVVESFHRMFRIDPDTGRVTDEVEVVRPKFYQEFSRAIPVVRITAEAARGVVANMAPGEISDFLEKIVGETPKRKVGSLGVFEPKSPLTSTLQWWGISTAPAPPAAWRQRIEALKRSAERKYSRFQRTNPEGGIVGDITGI
jgi:hypothetical protein